MFSRILGLLVIILTATLGSSMPARQPHPRSDVMDLAYLWPPPRTVADANGFNFGGGQN
jgi:hypothetical protein